MDRLLIAVVLVVVAVAVAVVIERRRPQPPTQPKAWEVPAQIDRADFEHADAPWLVAVFTSATCDSCGRTVPKAEVLRSPQVAVTVVPYQEHKVLHERYAIDVVPMTIVADPDGIVRASFIGEPTATDLWAAVAEVREPGSSPEEHPPGVV